MRRLLLVGVACIAVAIVILVERRSPEYQAKARIEIDEATREVYALRNRPSTITELVVDGIQYKAPLDPSAHALAADLLAMGVPAKIQGPFVARHCLAYVWAPPEGSSFRRALVVDDATCTAQEDGELVRLPTAICAQIATISKGFTPGVTSCQRLRE